MTASQRNNVKVIGSGPETIVFAHGYGCDQNMWRHVVPAFSDEFRIVLFDYVGSGLSDASSFDRTRYSTLRGYALDVVEILSELDLKSVHFVGHSVSSMIGALAFLKAPELIATLTMIGPSACYINSDTYHGGFDRTDIEGLLETLESNHVAWSATMAPVIMGNPETPEFAAELEASFCRMDPFLANHFARVTFLSDNRADLPKVTAKTLVLQCQKDAIAGLSVGEYVHKCLPNSQFVVIDATGHCPHLSAPKEVIKELRRFLEAKVASPIGGITAAETGELLELSPSGLVLISLDGSVLYANQAFLGMIGLDMEAVAGTRIQDFLTRGGEIFYETQFAPSLLIRGSLGEISFDFMNERGERVPTLVNGTLKRDGEGSGRIVLSIFGSKQRRLYETELLRARRESEEIAEVVRRSSDAILRLSKDDLIESWNRGAEQIFGYSAQEAIGKSMLQLIAVESKEVFHAAVETMKLGEEVIIESLAFRATGDPVDVSVNLSPRLEAPGTFIGYSVIIRNVSERKLAEKALLQTEKLASVGRLASSIAHEINNPLEAVTNLLYILESKDTDSETKNLIHTAQEELARVSQIATHTLRFHKQSSNRSLVDVRGLFDSVLGLYRARLLNSDITAINDADSHLSLVCFEGELRQILVNLVSNAFDAMRLGGTLTLRSRKISSEVGAAIRITVADTGSGMNAEVREHLFEPFFSTKGIGGTGLGLWITKDLILKNQGSIQVRSSNQTRHSGTVMSIRFPLQPDALP